MSNPTRFVNGVSTAKVTAPLANYPLPNPKSVFTYFEDWIIADFTNDYTLNTGATSDAGTAALTTGATGQLLFTTAANAATDYVNVTLPEASFNFSSTQQVWFETLLQTSDATNTILTIGLTSAPTGTTGVVTDGIYFFKAHNALTGSFNVKSGSTNTTQASVATFANATAIKLGFYYNGKDTVSAFVNDVCVFNQTTLTNLPDATALTPMINIVNGTAAAKTATIDYIFAAQDR